MYRFIFSLAACVLVFLPTGALADDVDDLRLVTEFYPPYNYEDDGEIKGISVDILLRALKKTGSSLARSDIELMQWSKGYDLALNQEDTLLFATTRTE